MEQVYLIALTMLLHGGNNHSASPYVRQRGLHWDDPEEENRYRAMDTLAGPGHVALAPDPLHGGASFVRTGPVTVEDGPIVPGCFPTSTALATPACREVTLFNAPPMVTQFAVEASQQRYGVALETWAPAPPNWAPAWSMLLVPKLTGLEVNTYAVASGALKHSLTWTSTPWSGSLQLPSGASLRPCERPVFEVRSLGEEPAFPEPSRGTA